MAHLHIKHPDLFRSLTPEQFAALDTPERRAEMRRAIEDALQKASADAMAHFPPAMLPLPRWP